ncbi:hypothetical protein SODALDRAFT_358787 [Sodiomyces alkalinus F11]|uniref:Uncharacterized protein n=1 Tax=Sodiomyces alkalinus (strain CBS 110278 / VKM F-3762 / F11) TaxID=1314773 RepID=A0A3N2PWQ4_SODAK|nr:hypothetical protein SODALDRAFT_358787 [Sodiomyces alkalinus F11]ROT38950.1 hypothetical protein SODALDRAFT_358787 [Sodiomyces alkalinus F11]
MSPTKRPGLIRNALRSCGRTPLHAIEAPCHPARGIACMHPVVITSEPCSQAPPPGPPPTKQLKPADGNGWKWLKESSTMWLESRSRKRDKRQAGEEAGDRGPDFQASFTRRLSQQQNLDGPSSFLVRPSRASPSQAGRRRAMSDTAGCHRVTIGQSCMIMEEGQMPNQGCIPRRLVNLRTFSKFSPHASLSSWACRR